ncbi:MAG: PHP domain-containing protein [Candidatus Kapabacteria bacterium]|nr:PHP domain-containing protein [Ignavibacteriota bacterium]MCW5883365.1 PHP domain-containing protein [Candidatus Kapabacteria bacterium]
MQKKVDLHTHTTYSDGILQPHELLSLAKEKGLSAISIVDHDTLDGNIVAQSICSQYDIEVLMGCEFSCYENGKEYHLLGYNFDPDNQSLKTHLDNYRIARLTRAKQIHKKLVNIGAGISFDEILETADKAPVARPHIASVLVKKGYAADLKEAFTKFLGEGSPAYYPKAIFPVEMAIRMINKARGVAVLAHPRNYIDQPTLYKFIQSGLDGIEVNHPSHSEEQKKFYHYVANQFWLLETGGSDYHGSREFDAVNIGNVFVPYSVIDSIKNLTGYRF